MQDKPEGGHEQAQAPPSPPPLAPIPPANPPPVPPIGGQGAATGRQDEQPDKLTKNDEVMIALTVAIALGTIVSAAAIVLQWREMVGGGKQTDKIIEAANINACAAKSFATSADKINRGVGNAVIKLGQQADDAEQFFRTDERAWVVISSLNKTETIPADSTFGTTFKFSIFPKNVGKTVARYVKIHAENPDAAGSFMENKHAILMSQDQLFRISGTNKRTIMPDNPGPQTLAPGAESPVPVFSGGQEPKRYADGNFRYSFILGRIDYTDAFGVRHWTHFCYFITNSKGELGHCKYGNDQDGNPEGTKEIK
jgi:hypothetical protein